MGAVFAPSALPDDGAWGSIYANLRQGQSVLFGGLMITVPTALPGFLIAVFFSILGRWRSWIPFTLAGGANGLVSWLVLGSYLGQLFWPVEPGILAASGIGGLAGGVAYWAATGQVTAGWRRVSP